MRIHPIIDGSSQMHFPIGVLNRIQADLPRLHAAERRVADVVIADPAAAMNMSIAELATNASTSEPTVMRLVRKVGCSGFSDFKLRLSQDVAVSQMFVFPEGKQRSLDPDDVAESIHMSAVQALAYSVTQSDPKALKAVAEAILAANRVFCFGIGGSSANIANEATNRLFRYDVHAIFSNDPYQQRLMAGLCAKSDVLLIFSVTGRPKELIDSAQIARELGAQVIAVTRPRSPLAMASTILLPLDISDHKGHAEIPHPARYGQMYILDCVATLVATAQLQIVAEKMKTLRAILIGVHGPTEHQPLGD
jgi:RpiR family carbohydrate utilization transcriptional regulator